MKETDKKIKEVSQQLGCIGNNNGAAAEGYFFNSFAESKRFGNEQFDHAEPNVRHYIRGLHDEYDIVLYNGTSIGIIEVKYTTKPKDIAQTLDAGIAVIKQVGDNMVVLDDRVKEF